jgi:hypothetical protein|nr:MAG TPA: hypothetical protein [Caudoviricetes sp.]
MDEGKEKAKKVWELLSETTYELDKNRRGYEDIEVLKEWIQNKNIYIIFHSDGWRGGEFLPNLPTSDFIDISKMAIEVIYKRLEQRNAEALKCVKEIQEILTEVEDDKGKNK